MKKKMTIILIRTSDDDEDGEQELPFHQGRLVGREHVGSQVQILQCWELTRGGRA